MLIYAPPFLFVCFGKSFGNVRNVLQTFPFPPPDQMLPHPLRKEETAAYAPAVLVAHRNAVLLSFAVPLPPGSGVGAPSPGGQRILFHSDQQRSMPISKVKQLLQILSARIMFTLVA